MIRLFTDIKNIINYTKSNDEEVVKKLKASNNSIIYFLPVAYLLFLSISKLFNSYTDITWLEIGIIFISTGLITFIYNIVTNLFISTFIPKDKTDEQKTRIKRLASTYFMFLPGNILVLTGFIGLTISLLINLFAGMAILSMIVLFLAGFYFINSWKLIEKSFILKKLIFSLLILTGIVINPTVLLSIIPFKYCIADVKITDKKDMLPTLGNRNIIIIDKISGLIRKPDYKEIVLLSFPEETEKIFPFSSLIKDISNKDEKLFRRIIAKQGDSILISSESRVILNNKTIDEPYIKETEDIICQIALYCKVDKIEENSYYLLGDNRNASQDSRIWSSVKKEKIKGKVFAKVWPLKDFKLIK